MFRNHIGNFCPNPSIYHFEMTNIIKMIILKYAMGILNNNNNNFKNNFTWMIVKRLMLKLEYLESMFNSIFIKNLVWFHVLNNISLLVLGIYHKPKLGLGQICLLPLLHPWNGLVLIYFNENKLFFSITTSHFYEV
jgi:hypothetical protein